MDWEDMLNGMCARVQQLVHIGCQSDCAVWSATNLRPRGVVVVSLPPSLFQAL